MLSICLQWPTKYSGLSQLGHLFQAIRHLEVHSGCCPYSVQRSIRIYFCENHSTVQKLKDTQLGDDHVHTPFPCERECAVLQQLVTSSLGCVLHCYDNLGVSGGHQVHGSPHPLHHLAGDHPVGQVATAGHLHCSQDGKANMATPDHGKTLLAREERAAGDGCHCLLTCIAPKMVRPTWPPLIMAKLSSLEKKELPGMAVTVCLPALIRSGSTWSGVGKGPRPRIPFSDCRWTVIVGGMKLDASIGIPIPRLAYIPSLNSQAALLTIFSLILAAGLNSLLLSVV